MGLDAVEIIMRTEESFGLSIPDKEAASMNTVGDLYEYVLGQTKAKGRTACISQAAFYKLRSALLSISKIDRKDLRPNTDLRRIFPSKTRTSRWQAVQQQTGFTMPALTFPKYVLFLYILLSLALTILLVSKFAAHMGKGSVAFVLLVLPLILIAALFLVTPVSFAIELPAGKSTLGDLTDSVVGLNYGKLADILNMQDEKSVWSAVQHIVSEQMQIDTAEITYGSTWGDLGVS